MRSLILGTYALMARALPRELQPSVPSMLSDLAAVLRHERARRGGFGMARTGLRAGFDLAIAIMRERWVATHGYDWQRRAARSGHMGWGERLMMRIRDLRLAVRSLLRRPGFAGVATLTLGLGIGATVAIFTLVNAVVLQPLAFPEADRIVEIQHHAPAIDLPTLNNSPGTINFYRATASSFESIVAISGGNANMTGGDRPERLSMMQASPEFWDVFRVQPAFGRAFGPDDVDPAGGSVALLTDGAWRTHFGSDRGVVGRTVELDGRTIEVIGVMPPSFIPPGNPDIAFVIPLYVAPDGPFGEFGTTAYGRMADGFTLESTRSHLASLQSRLVEYDPEITPEFLENFGWSVSVRTVKEAVVGDSASTLLIILGTMSFVLLSACANVANLFLVRAEGRQKELAIRAAMGAGRSEVAQTFLAESLVLGIAGGVLGMGIAWGGVQLLLTQGPQDLPRIGEVGMTLPVLGFAGGISVLAGLFLGAIPMSRYAGKGFAGILRDGSRGSTDSRSRHRARNLLVMTQLAMALVLLVGSGLMYRSFMALQRIDLGFEPENVLTVGLSVGDGMQRLDAANFYQSVIDRASALPGVAVAGFSGNVPLRGTNSNGGSYRIEDTPRADDAIPPVALYRSMGPGYMESVGMRLVEGRTMTRSDWESGIPVIWVNEQMRDQQLGGQALGRRIRWEDSDDYAEIVGVFEDTREFGVTDENRAFALLPMVTGEWATPSIQGGFLTLKLNEGADVASIVSSAREIVLGLNASVPVTATQMLEEVVAESMSSRSITMALLGIATALALFLGTIGLFGVISYVVSQRTREIGVRMALGAESRSVTAMVVRQGAGVVLGGILLGLVGAFGLTRVLGSLLYDVSATDPVTFVLAPLLLVAVSLLATWLPARKASKVDPLKALRAE